MSLAGGWMLNVSISLLQKLFCHTRQLNIFKLTFALIHLLSPHLFCTHPVQNWLLIFTQRVSCIAFSSQFLQLKLDIYTLNCRMAWLALSLCFRSYWSATAWNGMPTMARDFARGLFDFRDGRESHSNTYTRRIRVLASMCLEHSSYIGTDRRSIAHHITSPLNKVAIRAFVTNALSDWH